jgi:hypothetical protein
MQGGARRGRAKGDGAERLGPAEGWPARAMWPVSTYVGVACRTGNERTGGRTCAADLGTWPG